MNSFTVTITDRTQTPRNLADLWVNGSGGGYTVVGNRGLVNPAPAALSVGYLSIQASYGNSSTIVYEGDENVKNDGSRQAFEMANGDTDVSQMPGQTCINMNEIYITASANNAKINVRFRYA